MANELQGRVALVTGGGRGIGKAIAEGLAQAGAKVAITGRSQPHLDETVAGIKAAGGEAIGISADITDQPRIQHVVAETERQLGPLSILVNNAAIEGPLGPLWLNDTAAWKRCLETNVMGPVIVSQAVLPGMVERKFGHVVNVASGGGLWPVKYDTGYSVTKAGLIRLSEVMALECEEHNVMVFSIHPGVVHTNMSDTVMNDPNGQKWLPAYPEALARGMTPVEKAAGITVFLCSGRADGLSGCFLSVNDDWEEQATRAQEIHDGDMLTLRLQTTPGKRRPPSFQRQAT